VPDFQIFGGWMRLVWLAGLACLTVFPMAATPVAVNFKNAEIPPDATKVSLAYFLSNVSDTVFLRFKIPGIDTVSSINAFEIQISLFDDGDRGGETGEILFALPAGPNMLLGTFGPDLNGTNEGSPATFTFDLKPDQIAQVFPSIEDGNFRLKIVRDSGDFYVGSGSASIDANVVPEPGTLATIAIGFVLIVAGVHRRRRR
jgi:hypothetical protein